MRVMFCPLVIWSWADLDHIETIINTLENILETLRRWRENRGGKYWKRGRDKAVCVEREGGLFIIVKFFNEEQNLSWKKNIVSQKVTLWTADHFLLIKQPKPAELSSHSVNIINILTLSSCWSSPSLLIFKITSLRKPEIWFTEIKTSFTLFNEPSGLKAKTHKLENKSWKSSVRVWKSAFRWDCRMFLFQNI